MPLRDVQSALDHWIRAPEGVAQALEDEDAAASGRTKGRLESLIRGDDALAAVSRLEIYANAYFHRILGVLRSDYPALETHLGSDLFSDLVTSYLLIEPSRHPSLRYAGARLPGFLVSHEAAAGVRKRAPWAADLAAFEWTRIDAFDALDAAVLRREDLEELRPEDFEALPLALGPSVSIRTHAYFVDDLWRRAVRGKTLDDRPRRSSIEMLIWRRNEDVVHRRIGGLEHDALEHLSTGLSFGALCEWTAIRVDEEAAPALAAKWLGKWISDGLLIRPDL